jgi:hypothetical protein
MVGEHEKQMAGIPVDAVVEPARCPKCNGSGYVVERIEGQRPAAHRRILRLRTRPGLGG